MRFITLGFASLLFSHLAFAAPANFDKTSGKVEWKGEKVVGDNHVGTVDVKSGTLDVAAKKGEFVIDMKTITVTDKGLADDKKIKLAQHLSSPDFFDVSNNPEAKLVVKDLVKVANSADKYTVTGDLTIRKATNPITFVATIAEKDKKTHIDAEVEFDRSKFNQDFQTEIAAEESAVDKAKKAVDGAVKAAKNSIIKNTIKLKINLQSA